MPNQLITPARALDRNGAPQAGALAYIYQTGTTTQVTVTDVASTPLAWPVVADVNGVWPQMFYAGGFTLKAVLKDATGVTLPGGTIDPVAIVNNVSTASQIAFTPTAYVPQTDVQSAVAAIGATLGAGYQPLDDDLTAIAAISTTGFLSRTGTGTAAVRTFGATAPLAITNGGGVAGNPALTISTAATITGSANVALDSAVKTYVDTGLAAVGGMTFLGTLTTTSGSSQTLSGLTLTSYKSLQFVINAVKFSGVSNAVKIGTSAGSAVQATFTNAATGDATTGIITLDLTTGIFSGAHVVNAAQASWAGTCNITTASTQVVVACAAAFTAGAISVYGVK